MKTVIEDDDDYPPYPPERPRSVYPLDQSPLWREVSIIIMCGVAAGVAIATLLVVYGVF